MNHGFGDSAKEITALYGYTRDGKQAIVYISTTGELRIFLAATATEKKYNEEQYTPEDIHLIRKMLIEDGWCFSGEPFTLRLAKEADV